MGDKNPKNKAKDQKRKDDGKADVMKKQQAERDAKTEAGKKAKK